MREVVRTHTELFLGKYAYHNQPRNCLQGWSNAISESFWVWIESPKDYSIGSNIVQELFILAQETLEETE